MTQLSSAYPETAELRKRNDPAFGGQWNPSTWDTIKQLLGAAGEVPAPFGGVVGPSGFRALGDTVARMLASQAKGANPAEFGPAGTAAMKARDTLAESTLPVIERAMSRVRQPERAGQATAPQVSAQDLSQDFIAKDLQGVIDRYDPSGPKGLDAAIRSRAKGSVRAAREMEATVPKPGEGDIYRQSAKIARAQEDFRKQFGGRDPSDIWLARKFNTTPESMREMLRQKDLNQRYGAVRFDDLTKEGGHPFSEVISSEPGRGLRPPSAMENVEGAASESPNLAAATKFMEQLSPSDRGILESMMESKPTRQIADELKLSQSMVSRRQRELVKQLKDLREGRGFLGKMPVEKPPISGGSQGPPPIEYKGFQQGYGDQPGFHLYNLTDDIVDESGKLLHPKGSTVSEDTLRQYGIQVPKRP